MARMFSLVEIAVYTQINLFAVESRIGQVKCLAVRRSWQWWGSTYHNSLHLQCSYVSCGKLSGFANLTALIGMIWEHNSFLD